MTIPRAAWLLLAIGCRAPVESPPVPKTEASNVESPTADVVAMDRHGPLRFGRPVAAARTPAGETLEVPADGCHVVAPPSAGTPPRFTYLVHDGVVARIDVTAPAPTAEGGGHVGMTADDLRRAYPQAIEEPHKYDPKGATWIVGPIDAAHFVFELDGTGKVVTWRAGVLPQIDWVERCG